MQVIAAENNLLSMSLAWLSHLKSIKGIFTLQPDDNGQWAFGTRQSFLSSFTCVSVTVCDQMEIKSQNMGRGKICNLIHGMLINNRFMVSSKIFNSHVLISLFFRYCSPKCKSDQSRMRARNFFNNLKPDFFFGEVIKWKSHKLFMHLLWVETFPRGQIHVSSYK